MDMSEDKNLRETQVFGVVPGCVLGMFGAVHNIRSHSVAAWCLGSCALVVVVLALVARRWGIPLHKAGMGLRRVIEWLSTYLLLTVTFYVILGPFSLVAKLFGRDVLKMRFKPRQNSYWIRVPPRQFRKDDYTRQF